MWATVWPSTTLRKFEERSHLAETNIHLSVNQCSLVLTDVHSCTNFPVNKYSFVFTKVDLPGQMFMNLC